MKNLNQIIKSFDYSLQHQTEFIKIMNEELKTLPSVMLKFPKGRAVYRCRKHRSLKDNFFFEKDISYRTDISNITDFGRCNGPGSAKFYGSFDSPDIPQGHVIAVFETSDLLQGDSLGGIERYTIGKWIAKEDIEFMAIKPPNELIKDSASYKELMSIFDENWKNENVSEDHKEFYELIGLEFSKLVKKHENYKYFISAIISDRLLMHEGVKGIVYPSVQSDWKGLNIVMNPTKFDQCFQLEKVLMGDLFVFSKNSFFNNIQLCNDASKYPFEYTDIPDGNFLNTNQILQHFEQRNVNASQIITALIDQLSSL
jgi:hypothetical protein